MTALRAALPSMPPPGGPEDPGPFAFGDHARVTRILTHGGFAAPSFEKFEFNMRFPADPVAAATGIVMIGPASRVLREQPDAVKTAAIAAVAEAITPYIAGDIIALPGAVWLVTTTPV